MTKAVVLSSGGVDSTTCLSLALTEHNASDVTTVSIFYGQKHKKELESAEKVAKHYDVEHYTLDLSKIFEKSSCSLLETSGKEVPSGSYAQQMEETERVSTYVPFRNGLFLSAMASFADSLFLEEQIKIYYGAHADDAVNNAYADCSPSFFEAINHAIELGTYNKISVVAPFINKNKAEIVALGLELKTPYQLTWSCYQGGDKPCGKCGTCIDRMKAFEVNNAIDISEDYSLK